MQVAMARGISVRLPDIVGDNPAKIWLGQKNLFEQIQNAQGVLVHN